MNDKFNGFSQDEINKVCGTKGKKLLGQTPDAAVTTFFRGQHGGIRRMPDKSKLSDQTKPPPVKNKQPQQQRSPTSTDNHETNGSRKTRHAATANADEKLNRSLSRSIEGALFYQPAATVMKTNAEKAQNANTLAEKADDSSLIKLPAVEHSSDASTPQMSFTDDSSILATPTLEPLQTVNVAISAGNPANADSSPFKGISLKDFEAHRKMIQEQNKQKKELLYKAIERYSQKTADEIRKIEEIKTELAKLDNDLAVDVAILRKQIDNACVHFANVEKQYMKIETQFLRAKIDLHNAAEKKELLTEHLCTVIAYNEDRKAQKLSELMDKVGITTDGDCHQGEAIEADKC